MAINDRRVIFSTYVVPTRTDTMEEDSISHTTFQTSSAGTLGGKGIADITTSQENDGWTSMYHSLSYWADQDAVWGTSEDVWNGEESITSAEVLSDGTGKVKFLYIKNTGDTNDLELALNGANYYILIPPGGAASLRPNTDHVDVNEVMVQCGSGTTIEYIIAT